MKCQTKIVEWKITNRLVCGFQCFPEMFIELWADWALWTIMSEENENGVFQTTRDSMRKQTKKNVEKKYTPFGGSVCKWCFFLKNNFTQNPMTIKSVFIISLNFSSIENRQKYCNWNCDESHKAIIIEFAQIMGKYQSMVKHVL